jgi:hypothetical protein
MTKKDEDLCKIYWKKLMGQAKMTVAGASDSELKVQLFETLEEFFNGSNCWQEVIKFTVIPDTLDYPLVPENGRILRLYAVLDQNNVPQAAIMPNIGMVQFQYPYTEIQPMSAVVVKTVTDPILCYPPHIPDWLLPTYGIGLFHGLVGNVMLQPGQSYSNTQLANYHIQKFRDAYAHARVAMMKMNTVGVQAWRFPQTFRITSQKGAMSTFNVLPTPR